MKWTTLRDEAIRNKSGETPLPATLLSDSDIVPQGTYNPLQEQQDAEDASFGGSAEDMEDDQGPLFGRGGEGGGLGGGLGAREGREGSSEMGGSADEMGQMESDDGHGELVRSSSSSSWRSHSARMLTPRSRCSPKPSPRRHVDKSRHQMRKARAVVNPTSDANRSFPSTLPFSRNSLPTSRACLSSCARFVRSADLHTPE